jgi:uncharacterized protein GlcG (DUF336 family)
MAARDLRPQRIERIVLVTTALHMPRSQRVFERAGFAVIPAATDYAGQRPFAPYQLIPGPGALRQSHLALREWISDLYYIMRGNREQGADMQTKPMLTLDTEAAAEAEARANNWAVVIAVCDDGGHLILLHRIDGVAPISSAIGPAKASAAALGKRETKLYEDMINQGRAAFLSAPLDGMLEGGVPIVVDGHVVGAVGVSGVKSSEDAQIAKAGIAAL